jgi:hypothetical protein
LIAAESRQRGTSGFSENLAEPPNEPKIVINDPDRRRAGGWLTSSDSAPCCWTYTRERLSAEFMLLGPDCDAFAMAANDASLYHQLQRTNALQRKGPLHQELDRAAGRQGLIGFKQNTAAADVECLSQPKAFQPAFA